LVWTISGLTRMNDRNETFHTRSDSFQRRGWPDEFCRKNRPKYSPTHFRENQCITSMVGKSSWKIWSTSVIKKQTKLAIVEKAKIRPIWSPCRRERNGWRGHRTIGSRIKQFRSTWFSYFRPGFARFSQVQIPRTWKNVPNIPNGHKICQMAIKYTKLPQNIPNCHKIYQNDTKYTK
jgi:hypothetical protein